MHIQEYLNMLDWKSRIKIQFLLEFLEMVYIIQIVKCLLIFQISIII